MTNWAGIEKNSATTSRGEIDCPERLQVILPEDAVVTKIKGVLCFSEAQMLQIIPNLVGVMGEGSVLLVFTFMVSQGWQVSHGSCGGPYASCVTCCNAGGSCIRLLYVGQLKVPKLPQIKQNAQTMKAEAAKQRPPNVLPKKDSGT